MGRGGQSLAAGAAGSATFIDVRQQQHSRKLVGRLLRRIPRNGLAVGFIVKAQVTRSLVFVGRQRPEAIIPNAKIIRRSVRERPVRAEIRAGQKVRRQPRIRSEKMMRARRHKAGIEIVERRIVASIGQQRGRETPAGIVRIQQDCRCQLVKVGFAHRPPGFFLRTA